MNAIQSLLQLFYPESCTCCDRTLLPTEILICIDCRHDLPFFENDDYRSNALFDILKGRIPVEYAGSFLIFRKRGKVKNLIHHLKYRGKQEVGTLLGNWVGSELALSNAYKSIDCIIPVPLHSRKMKKRGYNQLTTFGKALSHSLNIPYQPDLLIRSRFNKTQTYKNRHERFRNMASTFEIKNHLQLQNKHVLLIDDVITTGATVESCCRELLKIRNIKISVFTMAITL